MDRAPRHGHGLVLYQRRARHVQPLIKAMNAKIVDSVGIETQKILHMENIKKIIYCRFCDQLTTEEVEAINDKSIDEVSSTEDCEDCRVMPMKEWQKLVRESR